MGVMCVIYGFGNLGLLIEITRENRRLKISPIRKEKSFISATQVEFRFNIEHHQAIVSFTD